MRIIEKIRVKKIAFCVNSTPANRFELLLAKSDNDGETAEIVKVVNDFLEGEFTAAELEKAIDKDKFLDAIALLKKYRPDMPDDVQASIDQLVKFAARSYGYGYGYPGKKEEEKVKKSRWPSFMPDEAAVVELEAGMTEDDEEKENLRKESTGKYLAPLGLMSALASRSKTWIKKKTLGKYLAPLGLMQA
ncbi:unnamed protein product, partial [marine sediment metagenome]